MKKITADDEIEDVMASLGVGESEELRESDKRKNNLEKFAQLRSRNPNVTLSLEDTHTAFVSVDEEIDEFKDITIPTKEFEQTVTDVPQKYFDYLLQRAFCNHETAHVLYSSWPAMEKYLNKIEDEEDINTDQYKMMFKHFVNVLEDGAIEEFLRQNFRVQEELLALRSSLHEKHYMGKEYAVGKDTVYQYPFFFSVMTAALNLGVYDNGELMKLQDEDNEKHVFAIQGGEHDREMFFDKVVPKIKEYIPKIQSERDAEKRMKLCYELWNYVRDYIDRSTTPGKDAFERKVGDQEGNGYSPNVPENLSESHGEQEQEPVSVTVQEDTDGEATGEVQKNELEEATEGGESEIEEAGKEGVESEARSENGDLADEIEEIINALGAGDGVDEIAIAEPEEVNTSRKRKAQRYGKRCERIFKRRLKQLQKDTIQRGRRRGDLDNKRMIAADRGSTRIFQQEKEGDKKNYSCMIVVDRSGSMSGRIEGVELAAGAVAYGLEENGVDTSILDTHNSMTTLSKPFGSSVDDNTGTIFGGRVGGGTPLTHTVTFARQRISRGRGDMPFMIIITDGRPSSVSDFKEQVRKANFPVLGVYMDNGRGSVEDQLSLYDRAVTIESDEDISQKLVSLIRGAIL